MRGTRRRPAGGTALEKAVYTVLFLVLVADVALIVFARADDAEPSSRLVATTTAAPAADAPADAAAEDELRPCSEADAERPRDEPIRCRTRTATLTIVSEDEPLVLGATQIRLLDARVRERTLSTRLRIRNETGLDQAVLSGGQQLYLNVDGAKVEPDPHGAVTVPSGRAVNTTLRFALTTGRLKQIWRGQWRAELGARPWDEGAGGAPGTVVGVVRFRARPGG